MLPQFTLQNVHESNGAPAGAVAPPAGEATAPAAAAGAPAPTSSPGPDPAVVAMQLENSRLKALVEFPLADREVLNMVSGTPEEIRVAAEKMHLRAATAVHNSQPTGSQTAVATPGPGQALPPENEAVTRRARESVMLRNQNLRKTIEPVDLQVIFDDRFQQGWNQHMIDRKNAIGRTA